MTNLRETNGAPHTGQIDTAGWLFAVLTVVIVGAAALVVYDGNYVASNTAHQYTAGPPR